MAQAVVQDQILETEPRLPSRQATSRRRVLLQLGALLVLSALLLLFRVRSLPLADPQESRCALIVQEMLRTGDWIVPRLEGQMYLDKPAPFFWLAAITQRLTGSPEAAGRLVAALLGLLCILVTYDWGRRIWGSTGGFLAGLVLLTSSEFLFLARWYRMDMPFAAAMWAALWCFRLGESANQVISTRRRWACWCGFYTACAGAVLLKGPAGLVLPVLVIAGYWLVRRQPRRLLELLNPAGIALFLLLVPPWYTAMNLRVPGYLRDFLLHQNLDRYATEQLGHTWSVWFYVPILLAGLVPWTPYLPAVMLALRPKRPVRAWRPDVMLLWLSAAVPFVVFSLAQMSLPNYILPVLPPLAVLIGGFLAEWLDMPRTQGVFRHSAKGMIGFLLCVPFILLGVERWLQCLDGWIAVPFATAASGTLGMVWCLGQDRRRAFLGIMIGAAIVIELYVWDHTAKEGFERMSTRRLVQAVARQDPQDAEVCFWPSRRLSFLFYAQALGIQIKESRPAEFFDRAQKCAPDHVAYCIVTGEAKRQLLLEASPFPVYELSSVDDCYLLSNRPAAQCSTGTVRE